MLRRSRMRAFAGLFVSAVAILVTFVASAATPPPPDRPNVVFIFADDMGYGDLHCYGSKTPTPHLDRMAAEGTRFTDFCAAQAVCSASRTSLLTGCYPNRVGIKGALGPHSKVGINDKELTLAEVFKSRGYATAIYGKWHLGDADKFLPTHHGFDEYFGLPYSNDMWPKHPSAKPGTYPDLPLIEGTKVVALNPDQTKLTTWYTEHAVDFIKRNKDRPFFLYVPHSMPHVPLHVSEKFAGKSGQGLYGDVIMEIDWSVGQILDALKQNGLDDHTLVMFASDNGPWLQYGDHAGSSGPFREGKATMFEGGVREPFIARWPGKIPAGRVCDELAGTIDVLPTMAKLIGADLPTDRIIDGKDIWPLLAGQPGAKTPHDVYFYYWGDALQAVRAGKWKLHFPHTYPKPNPPGGGGKPGPYKQMRTGTELYDLETDAGETTDVAAKHPEVVSRLQALAERGREDLGDSATGQKGKNVRPPGRVEGL